MAESEKQRLIAAINAARADMTRASRGLHGELDFSGKLRRSVAEHRALWIGVGAVVGLVVTRRLMQPPLKTKKEHKIKVKTGPEPKELGKAALIPLAAKFVFDLARPTLMKWMREKAIGRFTPRAHP